MEVFVQLMSLVRNLPECFTEQKQFRDNNNNLAGEVKHKLMCFSIDKK